MFGEDNFVFQDVNYDIINKRQSQIYGEYC